jgi:hypothetical protein
MPLITKPTTKATAPESRRVWIPPTQQKLKLWRSDFDRLTDSDKAAFMRQGGTIVNTQAEANVGLPASLTAAAKAKPVRRVQFSRPRR